MTVRHYARRGKTATEVNDLSAAVTWANVPDANITEGSVTQHATAIGGALVLDDISDVTETTITTGDVLRWNGSAWVNYADSNYGTLDNVVEDTTPQLGGDLDPNSNNIAGAGTIDMAPAARSVTATGNTATTDYSKVIRFTSGSGQTFTLDGDPPTNAVIMLDNSSGNSWTIAASTSLIWAKDATTGNRTLADDGIAVALHRGSGTWIINGSDLLT